MNTHKTPEKRIPVNPTHRYYLGDTVIFEPPNYYRPVQNHEDSQLPNFGVVAGFNKDNGNPIIVDGQEAMNTAVNVSLPLKAWDTKPINPDKPFLDIKL